MLLIGSKKSRQKGHSTLVLCDSYAVVLFHCFYHRFVAMLLFGGFIFVPLAKNHSLNFSLALLVSPLQIGQVLY